MLSVSDAGGDIFLVNQHWETVLGHPLERYLGRGWHELTHPDDLNATNTNLSELADGTLVAAAHSRLLHADGTYRWIRWHSWNSTTGILFATGIDVTGEYESTQRLRHLEQLREASFFLAKLGVFDVDVATQEVWLSQEIRDILEIPDDFPLTVETCLSFYPQPGQDELREAVQRAATHLETWDIEVPVVTNTGRDLWVRSFGRAETNADGVAVRIVGGFQDVTTRRRRDIDLARAVIAAEEATEAQRGFVAAMSHELRNPLHALLNIQTLLGQTDLTPDQHRLLRLMEEAGTTLSSLLNRVLQLSRLESGEMSAQSEPLDLAAVCTSSLDTLAPTRPDLTVRYEGPDQLTVLGDRGQLRQIVDNLVSNALRYTNEGSVVLSLTNDAIGQQVTVTDTGVGIDASRQEMIFDRFRRVDSSTDRFQGGTGLGLSIARQLARGMGGELTVRSQLGRGSSFTLATSLPRTDALEPSPVAPTETPSFPSRTRVLVADDEPIGRFVARRLLEQWNIDVIEASDGSTAVEAALEEQPHLVLMDCIMPTTDGWTAATTLRAQGFTGPILALSGSSSEVDIARAFDAGMNDHLCKPVRARELLSALTFWLDPKAPGHDS